MNGIYGRAATGLQDSSWAVNDGVAKVGARGEQKTEALLNCFSKKAALLHDRRIPIPGFKANVDHAIVSGKSVLLIDSKMWKLASTGHCLLTSVTPKCSMRENPSKPCMTSCLVQKGVPDETTRGAVTARAAPQAVAVTSAPRQGVWDYIPGTAVRSASVNADSPWSRVMP